MPPATKTTSIAMKTRIFWPFVGPRVRTTSVGVRGFRGRLGIGRVRLMWSELGPLFGKVGLDGDGGLTGATG